MGGAHSFRKVGRLEQLSKTKHEKSGQTLVRLKSYILGLKRDLDSDTLPTDV